MPIFNFKCPECSRIFEDLIEFREQTALSKCCNSESKKFWGPGSAPNVLIRGSWQDDTRLDGGCDFGEMPGDEDYEGINEPGYLGPIP